MAYTAIDNSRSVIQHYGKKGYEIEIMAKFQKNAYGNWKWKP